MKKTVALALVAFVLVVLGATSGCRRVDLVDAGIAKADNIDVPLGGADESTVRLIIGAGDLSVTGDDLKGDAIRGDFEYQPATLAPEIDVDESADRVHVEVRQGEGRVWWPDFGNIRNRWDIVLAEGVPTELDVRFGAGEGTLDLSSVDVRDLDIEMGAGDVTVDLSGAREHDVDASITQGAGEITIRVPEDVGVRITGRNDGLGDWDADGFQTEDNAWVNEAYEDADVRMEIDLQRGVGDIHLELVD